MQEFLEKYYWENDSVILWCSGWPDSMYLLYHILETSFAKNLVICYFNHKTRPETEEEEIYLERLAKEKWCNFESAECDFKKIQKLYPSKSFEELAREKRYQFFDAIMNIYWSKYVLTAHHLDDRIETMIFHMLRGTKLTWLINMKELHGWIIRPLLWIEKADILDHLKSQKLHYFTDSSNSNTDITRNKIRNELVPKLAEIHPQHKKNLSHLLDYFEELKKHIDQEIQGFLWTSDYFEIKDFLQLSLFMQKEIIAEIFYRSNNNSTQWLSEGNIAEIIKFINWPNNKTVKEIKKLKMEKDNLIVRF